MIKFLNNIWTIFGLVPGWHMHVCNNPKDKKKTLIFVQHSILSIDIILIRRLHSRISLVS